MSPPSSRAPRGAGHSVDPKALAFGLASTFLCGIGFSIIMPVLPFLVQPYVSDPAQQATVVTLLVSVYAACVFLVAPGLGALSDRFGRRPLLLVCLLGSAAGYLVLGIGGALGVLFVGRITEGLTGGSIGTIFAYFADITPRDERTKYFGWVSALSGAGVIIGPAVGGLLAQFGASTPLFFGAGVTLLNCIFGFFCMPESLAASARIPAVPLARLNPFTQLKGVLSLGTIGLLLCGALLVWTASGSLQGIFSPFCLDVFAWDPAVIGLVFSILGVQDIVAQGLVMPRLLRRLSDVQIAVVGMGAEVAGYALIAASALAVQPALFVAAVFAYGFGDSIFGPSCNGMLSKAADEADQGRTLGASQSLQSLARIVGPLAGGQLYVLLGPAAPACMGALLVACAIPVLRAGARTAALVRAGAR